MPTIAGDHDQRSRRSHRKVHSWKCCGYTDRRPRERFSFFESLALMCARRLRRECVQFVAGAANARSSVRTRSAAFAGGNASPAAIRSQTFPIV